MRSSRSGIDNLPGDARLGVSLLGMAWVGDDPGGLNRFFWDLAQALQREGVDVSPVVTGPGVDAPTDMRIAAPAEASLLRRLLTYNAAARSAMATTTVTDAHFALYAWLPVLLGRRQPLVVHFQGPWGAESAVENAGAVTSSVKRAIERAVYRRADRLIVLSEAFADVLVHDYHIPRKRIRTIPPGVDLNAFTPGSEAEARQALDLPAGLHVVVAVRRLVPRMGLDVLLRAWREVDVPDRLLVVVGIGPEQEALDALAAELGISERVRFVGRVAEETLPLWYRAARVTVVPSVALEGFGLIVLESLACGTPVIGTDVDAIPETLKQFDPSLVVPAQDAPALAQRITQALGAGDLPTRAACRTFAEKFDWGTAARRTIDVYDEARAIKVVYLDHTAELSGGELALERLLASLDGVAAHVVLGADGPLVGRLRAAGVGVEVLSLGRTANVRRDRIRPGWIGAVSALRTLGYVWRLRRRLREIKPHIVHTNSLKSALYGGLAGRLARVPVVWHVRDRIADDYLPAAAVRMVRAASRLLPRAVIANSAATLATIPGARRASVVPSPVAMISKPRRPAATPTIGVIGRLTPWKGQDVFLRAVAEVAATHDVRARICGAALFGEEEFAERLRLLSAELDISDQVAFVGHVDDVGSELAGLDVLVHCSTTPEPFGQVVVEGMAAGVPVIAANAGGPAEVVLDGVNGLLVAPGDSRALAEAIRRLLDDADLRARLAAAGPIAAAAFRPECIAPRVRAVYEQILGRR